jgi:CMP-N,N'-diacetyllegionaminic acid synthase
VIRRAYERLVELGDAADSIRAVEPARQHPGKMWTVAGDLIEPLLPQPEGETPLHSRQYQALPKVYAQNSSVEVAWSRVLDDPVPTISGTRIAPFFTAGAEGFSIDYPEDVELAERMLARGDARLPAVTLTVP